MTGNKNSLRNFVRSLKEDKDFRTKVGLYWGAVFNLFFAGATLYSGIRYQSVWFISLGVYYLVLMIVKFYIGRFSKWRGSEKEWRVLRNSGIVMIVMNLALISMISIMTIDPSIALHGYSKVVAIGMAVWTVYLLVSAIRGLMLLKGKRDPWLLANAMLNFIAAVVSVLMLLTAMTASFGTRNGEDLLGGAVNMAGEVVDVTEGAINKVGDVLNLPEGTIDINLNTEVLTSDKAMSFLTMANRVTGTLVGLLVLGLTVYMVVRGYKEDKRLRTHF